MLKACLLYLLKKIKKYDTGTLIEFLLKEENLRLEWGGLENNFARKKSQDVFGRDFFISTKEKFVGYDGLPAKILTDYYKSVRSKKGVVL